MRALYWLWKRYAICFRARCGIGDGPLSEEQKIHVRSGGNGTEVCCRIVFFFPSNWNEAKCFTVNVGVVLAVTYCRHDASTKEVDIKNVFPNGGNI